MAIATGTALVIAAATAAAGSAAASRSQRRASTTAAGIQATSTSEALDLERENEMRRRQEWDQSQAENAKRIDDANAVEERRYQEERDRALGTDRFSQDRASRLDAFDREQYVTRETQRAPYRDVSLQALNKQAALAGLPVSFSPSTSMSSLAGRPTQSGAA